MAPIFQRPASCFYCNTTVNARDTHSFRCPHCESYNSFNARGEIIGDEAAMRDETLNIRSFAKRASPAKDRLPSVYSNGSQFCRTCETNQRLLISLLANYLPPTKSPEYAVRLAALSAYRESLHTRYPPVCQDCMPGVEEEIQRKEAMARSTALGGFLGKGKSVKRSLPDSRQQLGAQLFVWKVRGFLWAASLIASLALNGRVAYGHSIPRQPGLVRFVLPLIALLSILWTVWDPTYSSLRRGQLQGRDVRVHGKRQYIAAQMVAWLSRVITSIVLALAWSRPEYDYLRLNQPSSTGTKTYFSATLALEVAAIITSISVLKLRHPPKIRLIDTTTHRGSFSSASAVRSSTAPPDDRRSSRGSQSFSLPGPSNRRGGTLSVDPGDVDFLAALSLSSKPVITSNPIFGLPSLLGSPPIKNEEDDEDAMDWTPTDPLSPRRQKQQQSNDDGSWLRPQRFFAPEEPTGLEGLFEQTRLRDDTYTPRERGRHVQRWKFGWAVLPLVVAGLGYVLWSKQGNVHVAVFSSVALPSTVDIIDEWENRRASDIYS